MDFFHLQVRVIDACPQHWEPGEQGRAGDSEDAELNSRSACITLLSGKHSSTSVGLELENREMCHGVCCRMAGHITYEVCVHSPA